MVRIRRSSIGARNTLILTAAFVCASCDPATERPQRTDLPGPHPSSIDDFRLRAALTAAREDVGMQSNASSWGRLGHLYLIHGWPAAAAACYESAHGLEPERFRWTYYWARALSETNLPRAAATMERALELDGTYLPAFIYGARILRELGEINGAAAWLKRAQQLAPTSPDVALALGQLALSSGDLRTASKHLLRALELDPDNAAISVALSQVMLASGDREAAGRHAERAAAGGVSQPLDDSLFAEVKRVGVSRFWLHTRGRALLQASDYEGALAQYAPLAVEGEEDPMVWSGYGASLLGRGRHSEALTALERAWSAAGAIDSGGGSLTPENLRFIETNLGQAYAMNGHLNRARDHLHKALAHDPTSVRTGYSLALVLFRADSLESARQVLEALPDLSTHSHALRLLETLRRQTTPGARTE